MLSPPEDEALESHTDNTVRPKDECSLGPRPLPRLTPGQPQPTAELAHGLGSHLP